MRGHQFEPAPTVGHLTPISLHTSRDDDNGDSDDDNKGDDPTSPILNCQKRDTPDRDRDR